jgi:hypothetical protein
MDIKKSGKITIQEIKEKLEQNYKNKFGGKKIGRKLIIQKSSNCYFLELDGTPPKGFGVYIPKRRRLCLYDAEGERFKDIYLQDGITDLNDSLN